MSQKVLLKKFGKQLATLRKQRKLSVQQLAKLADMDHKHLQKIEAGEVNIVFTTILALAKSLNIQPHELLQSL